ncbi:MAG: electron transport complex subunit RsxC [Clostridia bacterium]|nr:electron transport complex subunit RsxC [Clostridia bacterium]
MSGVHVPHRKNTAGSAPVRMPPPETVTIPLSMGIGAPSTPTVQPGEKVFLGQKIAEPGGFVSAAIFASVSGTVKKTESYRDVFGRTVSALVIESDGEMTPDPSLSPVAVSTAKELADAARACGLVGLGGAGFPTSVKLSADPAKVEYILLNGAECEPYITSDTRTMLDRTEELVAGMKLLRDLYSAAVIVGIERNKPEAVKKIREAIAGEEGLSVKVLPGSYPQGGEKVLIYNCTGRIVGEGKLPLDVGCVVLNVTTTVELMKYLSTGMPLVERCLTVDGSAVKEPKNVIVPIGTKMQDVFDFCGGFQSEPGKILYGGPMMGIAVPDASFPVMKTTNAIVALNERDAILPDPTPCIRCGKCANTCPLRLTPFAIGEAVNKKDADGLARLKVTLCMECGCCSFICPAHRPLVQQNKLGKAILRAATPPKGGK